MGSGRSATPLLSVTSDLLLDRGRCYTGRDASGKKRVMRRTAEMLELVKLGFIVGYEDGDGSGDQGGSDDGGEDDDNDDDGGDSDDDDDDDTDEGKPPKEDTEGLRKALIAERKANKANARELKKLRRLQESTKNKDETEKDAAIRERDEEKVKTGKLATRLEREAVNSVIVRHATKLGFRDLEDALALVDRSAFVVDQDEDDPSDIDIDEDSIKVALNALKTKKPHLILSASEQRPSGDNAGGGGGKQDLTEEQLRVLYPSLR